MNTDPPHIRLYGAARCHKSQFYQDFLKQKQLDFVFLDVEEDEAAASQLRGLYSNGKLNFPTLMVRGKKLRNPRVDELEKWLAKKGLIT